MSLVAGATNETVLSRSQIRELVERRVGVASVGAVLVRREHRLPGFRGRRRRLALDFHRQRRSELWRDECGEFHIRISKAK